MRRTIGQQLRIHLIEADVDIGFGLVDEAKAYSFSGQPEFRAKALENAAEIVLDIEHRLAQIGEGEALAFLPLLAELKYEITRAGEASPTS